MTIRILVDKIRPDARVYGPYLRRDGRKHVVLWWSKDRHRTISYPKWLMEQRLGRELDPDLETVDHIDRVLGNNSTNNFQLLPRPEHTSIDNKRAVPLSVICVWCRSSFQVRRAAFNRHRRNGKVGPFCSKQCSGEYGASVQNGRDRLPIGEQVPLEYNRITKTVAPG